MNRRCLTPCGSQVVRTPELGPGTVIQDVDAALRRRKPTPLPAVSVDFNPSISFSSTAYSGKDAVFGVGAPSAEDRGQKRARLLTPAVWPRFVGNKVCKV